MAVFDAFFKRQKRIRGELPDVFTYENLPIPFRIQIVQIMQEALGVEADYIDSYRALENIRKAYRIIVETLRKEIGVFRLPPSSMNENSHIAELANFILQEPNVEYVLSALELICRVIRNMSSSNEYIGRRNAEEFSRDCIQEINTRLREHGLGFEYDDEIIRIDAEFVHADAVKPALSLLRSKRFSGAEQEFMSAFSHFRKGNNKEALNEALKSLESTMKTIYDGRKWTYSKKDTASRLIKIAFDNKLVPAFWESHFTALRTTLEAGVPTARNNLSGHGQGSVPTEIPTHLASYVLHLTASAIVFLVKADESLAK